MVVFIPLWYIVYIIALYQPPLYRDYWYILLLLRHRTPAGLFFALILATPSIFGTIVRYEPNLANIAWVSLGCAALLRSEHLRQRNWVLLWGISLGCGLMTDRLSVLFFLIPAIIPLIFPIVKERIWNAVLGLMVAIFLSAAYYREFFIRNLDEITSQVGTGEIDSTGTLQKYDNPIEFLYYFVSILDTQLGLFIGSAALICLIRTLIQKKIRRDEWSLVFAIIGPILFFSCIAKKQIYYTLPILWPLLYFVPFYRRTSYTVIPLGLLGIFGYVTNTATFNYSWMPEKFVAPRHVLLKVLLIKNGIWMISFWISISKQVTCLFFLQIKHFSKVFYFSNYKILSKPKSYSFFDFRSNGQSRIFGRF